jgi:GrpB-like predicted nucleotidyltransferase (UPF0157 family)
MHADLAIFDAATFRDHATFERPQQFATGMVHVFVNGEAVLRDGEPRNAIVAAWDRFEEQAERVGVARKLWETSSEFTLRLLDAVAAAPPAVSRLAVLYREARFSEHEINEANRQAAVEALREIHASIAIPAGATR